MTTSYTSKAKKDDVTCEECTRSFYTLFKKRRVFWCSYYIPPVRVARRGTCALAFRKGTL